MNSTAPLRERPRFARYRSTSRYRALPRAGVSGTICQSFALATGDHLSSLPLFAATSRLRCPTGASNSP
jgi:hypothetical protein